MLHPIVVSRYCQLNSHTKTVNYRKILSVSGFSYAVAQAKTKAEEMSNQVKQVGARAGPSLIHFACQLVSCACAFWCYDTKDPAHRAVPVNLLMTANIHDSLNLVICELSTNIADHRSWLCLVVVLHVNNYYQKQRNVVKFQCCKGNMWIFLLMQIFILFLYFFIFTLGAFFILHLFIIFISPDLDCCNMAIVFCLVGCHRGFQKHSAVAK